MANGSEQVMIGRRDIGQISGYSAPFANRHGLVEIKLHDIVQLVGGTQMIVVRIVPSRPSNPYVGVKVNGHGTEYKFGYKHSPRVIGKAGEDHPALRALASKNGAPANTQLAALARAVLSGDLNEARRLALAVS